MGGGVGEREMKLRQERQSCGSCKNADDQPRLSAVVAARCTMSCTHAAATPTPRAAFAFDAETQRQQQRRHMWQMQRWQPQQVVAAFSHAHIIIAIDASCTRCTRAAFSTLSSLRQIRCVVYDSPSPHRDCLLLCTWLHAAAFCMPQIPCGKPTPAPPSRRCAVKQFKPS